jgi:hypothetical protein
MTCAFAFTFIALPMIVARAAAADFTGFARISAGSGGGTRTGIFFCTFLTPD